MSYIEVKNLNKNFIAKNGSVEAIKDLNLSIEKRDIFGVIGLSGAGKSTFVRCLNLLEKPTSGEILIDGVDIQSLKGKDLRFKRQKIGMIFQNFNLLEQRTVLGNVCFPMEIQHVPKSERKEKALELLRRVGLEDKAKAYPSQLSGGQKQRVAIARVLASNPDVILCDEATSALDPQTTQTILALLKDIHDTSDITVVIITHEMKVISQICSKVAVLDKGVLKETGSVDEVFNNPTSAATKRLLLIKNTEEQSEEIEENAGEEEEINA